MAEGQIQEDPKLQVEEARKEFNHEFERFVRFGDSAVVRNLTFEDARAILAELDNLSIRHTGKKSKLAALRKLIGRIPKEDRPAFALQVQTLESDLQKELQQPKYVLGLLAESKQTEREAIDVTLPGRRPRRGHLHPITILRERIEDIFVALGYVIEDGREV